MKKILMTLMGLEIGGAETHVVELAIELSRRGYEISVASNGGVYVADLEQAGITHYQIPLHNKKPMNMLKSYRALKKLIKQEKFDVVHAHARIPAFLCGMLAKKLKFRFVTSAHWVFRTSLLLNKLTNWGERTIAVSNDIKAYLEKNYGVIPQKIFVTINGIDTNKFSKEIDASKLRKELLLSHNARRIVYVSRMDTDRSAVAFMLIDALLQMNEPDLELVIVGGGNDLDRLKKHATDANNTLHRRAVIVTGSRTDINKCIALGDIFVGVSRAALEAMACEKPTIIAGNEGYIGICNQENMPISVKTNFCCRGCPNSSVDLLIRDIRILFDGDMDAAGKFGRQVIIDNYSVSRMGNDCISAYKAAIQDKTIRRVMVSGYYGFNNLGDDSLLQSIITTLREISPNSKITVLSQHPRKTRAQYNVHTINRKNPFAIIYNMLKGDLLINGGGSLLQDITSTKSILYYISIMYLGKLCGMKNIIYANGIGPIKNKKNRKRAQKVLEAMDIITLRDKDSLKEIKALNVSNKNVFVSADPAFTLDPCSEDQVTEFIRRENLNAHTQYVLLSVREYRGCSPDFADSIASLVDYIEKTHNLPTIILPMQPRDNTISQRVKRLSKSNATVLSTNYTANEILGLLSYKVPLVIGMRLHTLIYSTVAMKPMIALSYDPKIDALMYLTNQEDHCHSISDLNLETLKTSVDHALTNRDEIATVLYKVSREMRNRTLTDRNIVTSLLKKEHSVAE